MKSPRRFVRSAWVCRRRHRIPLTRQTLRALWIQSDPDWLAKLPGLDLTDEEWELFARGMGK